MDERKLGRTSLTVSRLGLGTVELGMPYGIGLPTPPDDAACIALLHEAWDHGISFIDTAAAYGRSEELVGRAFGRKSTRPVIATKAATQLPGAAGPLVGAALRQQLEASVASSLRKLRLDTLDLLQFHSIEPEQLDDDLFVFMDSLCRRGWVRYWGASTYGERAPRAGITHSNHLVVLQVAYNMLDRRLERELLPACAAAGLGVVFRSVFLKGVLTPRYIDLPEHMESLRRAAAAAATLADDAGMSLSEMALRFAAYSPYADVALCGTGELEELHANLRAVEAGPLSPDLITAVRGLQVAEEELLNPATWGF